ncbi:MAG: PD40 domain-containing protein [Ardenticatenaceae bacterium]|nr:PD40 domain-containing protein [Ardenticatenaceae bacterium]MCB9442972.1 PD40 domain-containing protein [Ardenticatenaceae bacterium]
MDDYDFDEFEQSQPEPVENGRSRWKPVFYLGLIFVLIVGLLWSGISGVVWLVQQARQGTAVTTENPPAATNQPLPTFDPANAVNRIVYIDSGGQVATIAPDGSEPRQLTDDPVRYQFPAWSPDGEYIAALGGRTLVRLTDTAESDSVELYSSRSQNPFYFYWSPDSRSVTFLANHPSGIGLHLAAGDGESASRLLATGSPFYWDWQADSTQILIHAGSTGENARLALLDVESGSVGPNVAAPGFFQVPDISYDGRYWAYAERDGSGNSWLVLADGQTGEVQRQRHAGQVALGWSPVADQVAFISTSTNQMDFTGPLRLMDAATGETTLLSRDPVAAFFWSPDGRYLAVISLDQGLKGDIVEGNGRRTLGKSNTQTHPDISLNLSLIDVVTGEKRRLLSFQPSVIFITQFLPYFDQYALSHPIWSPDSLAIVLPMSNGRTTQITVVPVSGGSPHPIAEGDMPFWSQQ